MFLNNFQNTHKHNSFKIDNHIINYGAVKEHTSKNKWTGWVESHISGLHSTWLPVDSPQRTELLNKM